MPDTNLSNTTQTDMKGTVTDFSISPKQIDSATMIGENFWDSPRFSEYYGYYDEIGELKSAVNALATWSVGKGYETNNATRVQLDRMRGWGEDSFDSIIWNAQVIKTINGDSFTQIIRNENGTLINLKPLTPNRVRIVVDDNGMIDRYEYLNASRNQVLKKFKPSEILHLCRDRLGDQIHGTSVLIGCKWVIDARNEAMRDWRRILHRSTIRVMYVDIDNTSKLTAIKEQYADAIKNGELMIIPGKKTQDVEFEDLIAPPVQNFLETIRYYEGFFYQAVNIPQAIANSRDFTEAASKVGFMTFDPVWSREAVLMEQDLWNQAGIRIKFNKPPSLTSAMQESEAANTGQTGFQPNEVQAGVTRNE